MKISLDLNRLEKLIVDGLKLSDISKEMGVSLSTIKRRVCEIGTSSHFFLLKREKVICLNCNSIFESLLTDKRKFCSSSCSSKFNNSIRIRKEKDLKKRVRIFKEKKLGICINCSDEIIRSDGRTKAKYCSIKCQHEFITTLNVHSGKASDRTIKSYLIKKYGEKCMECGWDKRNVVTDKVPVELDHIDGNSENNNLDNLKLLCPNCHSLTATYKALNRGNGRHKRRERYSEGKSY